MPNEQTTETCRSRALVEIHRMEDAFLPEDEGGNSADVMLLLTSLPELACRYPRDTGVCLHRLVSFAEVHGPKFIEAGTFGELLREIWSIVKALFECVEKLDRWDENVLTDNRLQFEQVGSLARIYESSIALPSWRFLADLIISELNFRCSEIIKNAFVLELMPLESRHQAPPSFQAVLIEHFRTHQMGQSASNGSG
jgi:hypothetical protein